MSQEIKYKSFICYRGKLGGARMEYAPSEDVATMLAQWINENENLDVYPALFEAKCKAGEVTYDAEGIDKFMPGMKRVFAVICPDFFREIIDKYNEALEEMNKEDAFLHLVRSLQSDKNQNIYYFELKRAFEEGGEDNNIVCPIVVRNGLRSPTLNNREGELIIRLFGKKMHELIRGVNPITFNYECIRGTLSNDPRWNEGDKAEKTVKELEMIPEVAALKKAIIGVCDTVETARSGFFTTNDIMGDLQKCTQTISNNQLPKSVRGSQSKNHFYASNPNIIYDPVFIRHRNPPPPFLAKCMVDEFNRKKQELGLSSDNFGFWNVDFSPGQRFDGISVCAVCFGTLILQHRLMKDGDIFGCTGLDSVAEKRFTDNMNAGINLLIALRNPYLKTWPSSWIFSDDKVDREGTVNQTTLSISTILSCGFLSRKNQPDDKILKARYEFVWESVEQLISGGISYYDYNDAVCNGWGYGIIPSLESCDNGDGEIDSELAMTAFTVFVFDTFLKLGISTGKLMERFSEDKEFLLVLQERKNIIDYNIRCILYYFKDRQNKDDGAFSRSSVGNRSSSLTHTAHVTKSLFSFLNDYFIGEQESEIARLILAKTAPYIVGRVKEMRKRGSFTISDFERFEIDEEIKAAYGNKNMDQYEHSSEFIVAITLMKIAKAMPEYKKEAVSCINWIMNIYLGPNSKKIVRNGATLLVTGSQERELPYPIFYIYYYRMMLHDYMKFIDGSEDMG